MRKTILSLGEQEAEGEEEEVEAEEEEGDGVEVEEEEEEAVVVVEEEEEEEEKEYRSLGGNARKTRVPRRTREAVATGNTALLHPERQRETDMLDLACWRMCSE